MTIALVMLMAIGLQAQGKKMLVTYFSWSNNTKALAEEIQRQTGADIYRIEPREAYTTVYQTLAYSIANAEKEANARPALKDTLRTMNDYDIVAGIETLSAAKERSAAGHLQSARKARDFASRQCQGSAYHGRTKVFSKIR